MNTTMTNVRIVAAKRFKMDNGTSGAQFFCLGENKDDENYIGNEVMKMSGDFELLDRVRGNVPGSFDVDVELVRGAQDKMSFRAIAFKPVPGPAAGKSSSAAGKD
ncbi:hypothetical protein [Marinobacterium arenosum]|uniref:hypothetical protein n=1 Tax=Marinobacterium arenosum TaxID=2862496 RepID=UPI001C93EC3B|nr:hypothetical protein [Marinobacterium arenosum]MBY4675901.1 hypothetical protein [Marinobacterium arenosum]